MDKRTITIYVDNNTTQNEIKNIRSKFKQSKYYQNYRLNIIVSGNQEMRTVLEQFLLSIIKS